MSESKMLSLVEAAKFLEINKDFLCELVYYEKIKVYAYSEVCGDYRQLENGLENSLREIIGLNKKVQAEFVANKDIKGEKSSLNCSARQEINKNDLILCRDDLIEWKKKRNPLEAAFEFIDGFKNFEHFKFNGKEYNFFKHKDHQKIIEYFYNKWPKKNILQEDIVNDLGLEKYERQISRYFKKFSDSIENKSSGDEKKYSALLIRLKNGQYRLNID